MTEEVDCLVVGGGINGAGIARDAAGRGLRVLLCEQGDLGGHTSSASTKLIHGGLRYLEHGELRLVREALAERERLLAAAPHIIRPLRFVLPHEPGLRPAWAVRLGLLAYDHLAPRRRLPPAERIDLKTHPAGAALQPRFTAAFAYSDCWVEDSRLVVLAARDAAERGAAIRVGTRLVEARRGPESWDATLEEVATGRCRPVRARAIVNAAGPWVADLVAGLLGPGSGPGPAHRVRLVKGSHIVVPRLHPGEHAFTLQNADRRVVFAIPYEGRFTLIGTTERPFAGDPAAARIDPDEVAYLCEAANRAFRRRITPADVVWSYSGVRPLHDDGRLDASTVTRDYAFDLDAAGAPLLSVFGGKITTFRRLAEHAMAALRPHLPAMGPDWTAAAALPGGDMPDGDFERFLAGLIGERPLLPEPLLHRLARAYGTRVGEVLGSGQRPAELGRDLGGGLTEAELDHLVRQEWARSAEDVLWRRTKLGLHAPPGTAARIADHLAVPA